MRILLAPLLLVLFDWSPVKASAEPLDDAQIKDILLELITDIYADTPENSGNERSRALATTLSKGRFKTAKFLLEQGTALPDDEKSKALVRSFEQGSMEMANILIRNGATFPDDEARSKALAKTVIHPGNLDLTRLLLNDGASPDFQDESGKTPLMKAAGDLIIDKLINANIGNTTPRDSILNSWTNEDAVRILLNFNADPNVQDHEGRTALMYAASWGNENIVSDLLKNNATVDVIDNEGNTALHYGIMKYLNCKPSNIGAMVHWLKKWDNKEALQVLIAHNASVNVVNNDGFTPLLNALIVAKFEAESFNVSIEGTTSMFDLLLRNGASPNFRLHYDNSSVFMLAVEHCSVAVVETMLHYKPALDAVDYENNTILIRLFKTLIFGSQCAKKIDILSKAKLILNYQQEIDRKNHKGQTALHFALKNSCGLDIVQLLMMQGASLKVKDDLGRSGLVYASEPEVIEFIVSQGADLDAQDKNDDTALMLAAARYDLVKTRILLERGANVNIQNLQGKTALMLAVFVPKEEIYGEELSAVQDQYKIVELLLENGAVTSTTDSDGRTALDYVTKSDDVVARCGERCRGLAEILRG